MIFQGETWYFEISLFLTLFISIVRMRTYHIPKWLMQCNVFKLQDQNIAQVISWSLNNMIYSRHPSFESLVSYFFINCFDITLPSLSNLFLFFQMGFICCLFTWEIRHNWSFNKTFKIISVSIYWFTCNL